MNDIRSMPAALLLVTASLFGFGTVTTAAEEPITPTAGPINLLENDLERFYTFSRDTKYDDPLRVYSLQDGVLRVTGESWGGLTTKAEYADYHMVVEFKWGERTWGDRKDRARDSGIMFHGFGPDGGYSGVWLASIEAQIIEGGVGDILAVPGKTPDGKAIPISISAETTTDRDGETVWRKGGQKQTFGSGRINWYGRDPDWTDKLGYRGRNDVDSPHGEWTRYEIICDGDKVTLVVNGIVVNKGFAAKPSAGKILIQSEGAEIFVRRWELWPLGTAPRAKRPLAMPTVPDGVPTWTQ